MITGAQIKAARELLGWSRYRLAPRADIGHKFLIEFENGERTLDLDRVARLKATLEAAGVEFTNGGAPGVMLRATGERPK
jgi:transcriptional regulator with XRE-family HTH domain